MPVCQQGVQRPAERALSRGFNEPQRQMLRQRGDGNLLGHTENRITKCLATLFRGKINPLPDSPRVSPSPQQIKLRPTSRLAFQIARQIFHGGRLELFFNRRLPRARTLLRQGFPLRLDGQPRAHLSGPNLRELFPRLNHRNFRRFPRMLSDFSGTIINRRGASIKKNTVVEVYSQTPGGRGSGSPSLGGKELGRWRQARATGL
jgi:hypothetical protein